MCSQCNQLDQTAQTFCLSAADSNCTWQVNKATFVRVDYAGDLEEAINRQIE